MDRDRLKKMGKKSCFFVYKSGDADVEKKNPEINFVKALSAVCAVLLWRNAFLSVFDLEALANQIGRKEIIFAEIAVSFAVFILLIAAFKVRRIGSVIAYLVIFAPFIYRMRAKISAAMGVVDVGFCRGIVWNVLCNGRMQS